MEKSKDDIKKEPNWDRICVRLNSKDEKEKIIQLFRESGMSSKSAFVRKRIYGSPFKVIHRDRSSVEVVDKMNEIFSYIRRIGHNYNQVVKRIHVLYGKKEAEYFLSDLKQQTKELVLLMEKLEKEIEKIEQHDS